VEAKLINVKNEDKVLRLVDEKGVERNITKTGIYKIEILARIPLTIKVTCHAGIITLTELEAANLLILLSPITLECNF
jgi:hypothetical protein